MDFARTITVQIWKLKSCITYSSGLYSEATSNGFIIDNTAPVVTMAPRLGSGAGSLVSGKLIYRTSIRVEWGVEDPESYTQRQYLSISSHIGGDFNKASTEVSVFYHNVCRFVD